MLAHPLRSQLGLDQSDAPALSSRLPVPGGGRWRVLAVLVVGGAVIAAAQGANAAGTIAVEPPILTVLVADGPTVCTPVATVPGRAGGNLPTDPCFPVTSSP